MSQIPYNTAEMGPATVQRAGRAEFTRPATRIPVRHTEPPPERPEPGAPARLVITRGPEAGAVFPVTRAVATIGRHRDCDIVLDQVTVSRYHAELHRDGDSYTITDAGSLNGIYHNHRQVDRAELRHGDQLWIGIVHFTFHASA